MQWIQQPETQSLTGRILDIADCKAIAKCINKLNKIMNTSNFRLGQLFSIRSSVLMCTRLPSAAVFFFIGQKRYQPAYVSSARLRVLFIGLVLLLIWMGQKFGPCNAQLSSKTRIPQNSTLTMAIMMTRSIIGLDLPKISQVQLSGLLQRYLSGWLYHSSVLPASSSTIFTIKWYVCFTFVLSFF